MKTTDFITESLDKEEYTDEAGMAKTNLHTIIRACTELDETLLDDENLPEWVQEKIAAAKGMMVAVADYMLSQHEMGDVATVAETFEDKFDALINEMTSASVATVPATGTGKNVGSLFGGSYTPKGPFKKKATKKESIIKR